MHRWTICILALTALPGCGPVPTPVPGEEPFEELAPDLEFGMYAADLESARPGFHLSRDGTYGEIVREQQFSYLFVPKTEGIPPPLTARLVGIESRVEFFDTLRIWPEWHRLVSAYSAHGLTPRCSTLGDRRVTLSRADFDTPVRRRVTAEIIRGLDGQSYEAFLVVRLGVGELESALELPGPWREVDCEKLAGGLRRDAFGRLASYRNGERTTHPLRLPRSPLGPWTNRWPFSKN